jgi:hypothetical protein
VYKHLWAHLVLEHGWDIETALDLDAHYDDTILPKHKENERDADRI